MNNVISQVGSKIMLEVWDQVKLHPVWYRVSDQPNRQVRVQVWEQVGKHVNDQLREVA